MARRHREPQASAAKKFNRLSVLLLCLLLTLVITAFSIWYNLTHVAKESPDLFDSIFNKFEQGFSQSNTPVIP